MGAIKIINILKGDEFEEVLGTFRAADAQEVIFIFPKNSRIAQKEDYFAILADEAHRTEKTISIMTADERLHDYAEKYGFHFMASPVRSVPAKTKHQAKVIDNQPEPPEETESTSADEEPELIDNDGEETKDEEEFNKDNENNESEDTNDEMGSDENENIEEETAMAGPNEPTADLAVARFQQKSMSDIRHPETANPLKIKKESKSSAVVPIKKEEGEKSKKLERIWLEEKKEDKETGRSSIWKGLKFVPKKLSPAKTGKRKLKLKLSLLAGAVIALMAVLYFNLGQAQITIEPQKQELNFPLNISASPNYSETDAALGRIPGQLIVKGIEASRDFVSTGQKEVAQKSRGEITVYNNYNSEPQMFIATTRFESSGGLIFRTPQSVIIPGARLVDGKLVPGTVTIQVLADKPGGQYNIGPDRFTIPGLKGTPKFEGFYAESKTAMAGGLTGLSKVVTEKDFNDAKNIITTEARQKIEQAIAEATTGLKMPESFEAEVVSLRSTAEIGDAAEGFSMKETIRSQTIAFSEDEIFKIIGAFINKEREMILLKDTTELGYFDFKFDAEKKVLSFKLTVKGQAAAKINEEKIITEMIGMKHLQIKGYLESINGAKSAKVSLSPFWIKKIPKNRDKVQLLLVY